MSSRARLSLRLWAAPHAAHALGKVVLFEHATLVLIIDAEGIAAVACEGPGREPDACLVPGAEWPQLQLVRQSDGTAQWLSWRHGQPSRPIAAAHVLGTARAVLTDAARQCIVSAIHDYYMQTVLEPSVKGFLSILEKQFPRADLYLFELLQNAVDDGAESIVVELDASASAPSLRLTHDGRGFSPLDVNGLASVGMSTKTSRRAAGFMGIGFKACHKRFAQVVCSDPHWRFEFAEPPGGAPPPRDGPALPPSAWVLLPRWVGASASSSSAAAAPPTRGCCFELRRPRGGLGALQRDLRWLPPSVPPLLARCAFARRDDEGGGDGKGGGSSGGKGGGGGAGGDETARPWRLEWAGERLTCDRYQLPAAVVGATTGPKTTSLAARGGGAAAVRCETEALRVTLSGVASAVPVAQGGRRGSSGGGNSGNSGNGGGGGSGGGGGGGGGGGSACAQAEGCWVFLSVLFPPGRAAWQAYATHTRRDDPGLDAPPEEASLFFKARPADGLPLPSGGADCLLHALLPTKVASPFAGHVQAADL